MNISLVLAGQQCISKSWPYVVKKQKQNSSQSGWEFCPCRNGLEVKSKHILKQNLPCKFSVKLLTLLRVFLERIPFPGFPLIPTHITTHNLWLIISSNAKVAERFWDAVSLMRLRQSESDPIILHSLPSLYTYCGCHDIYPVLWD